MLLQYMRTWVPFSNVLCVSQRASDHIALIDAIYDWLNMTWNPIISTTILSKNLFRSLHYSFSSMKKPYINVATSLGDSRTIGTRLLWDVLTRPSSSYYVDTDQLLSPPMPQFDSVCLLPPKRPCLFITWFCFSALAIPALIPSYLTLSHSK